MDKQLRADIIAFLRKENPTLFLFWCTTTESGYPWEREPTDQELLTAFTIYFDTVELLPGYSQYRRQLQEWYMYAQTSKKPLRPEIPEQYYPAKAALLCLTGQQDTEMLVRENMELKMKLLEAEVKLEDYKRRLKYPNTDVNRLAYKIDVFAERLAAYEKANELDSRLN